MTPGDPTSSAEQFNAHADKYASSEVHRYGPSLPVLLDYAAPSANDDALDVATGTGNTALALAPHVRRVIGVDVAGGMLAHARARADREGVANADFVSGSAEELPFADGAFTLVVSRHAPHHFAHLERFLAEAWRVLKPGGRLVVADQISPSAGLRSWVDTFQRTRDPSHHAQRTAAEWRELTDEAGFVWARETVVLYRLDFPWWTAQSGCMPETVVQLREQAVALSPADREAAGLVYEGGELVAHMEPMLVVRLERP